ncbi:hypothetical protein [Vibrio owensii]|uniref:hypothetical protein n=1 Tax=Vibrio harveyi group TaxID=717610 RepID=UPI003CC511C3
MDSISLDAAVSQIGSNLMMLRQWALYTPRSVGTLSQVQTYTQKAEAILELVETIECGSIGGFAPGQNNHYRTFLGRFLWQYKRVSEPTFPWEKVVQLIDYFDEKDYHELIS